MQQAIARKEQWHPEKDKGTQVKNMLRGIIMVGALWTAVSLPANSAQTQPDNTNTNKQDQKSPAVNADKAQNNLSDRELMAHIRRDIVKDKSLSTYAHNVKIVSRKGKVTLRGPVRSDQEKQSIEQYAKKYAGDQNVINEVAVKSSGS